KGSRHALAHPIDVDIFDRVSPGFWKEFLQPFLDAVGGERHVIVLIGPEREDRAPQTAGMLAAHLEEVAPLLRIGKIVAIDEAWIDGAEVEAGRDLDELLRIGESFEVDAGDPADGAMAAVATDHIAGVEPLGAGWRGNLDVDAVSLRRDAG